MKRISRTGDQYVVEFDVYELRTISSGLGWADVLIKDEAVFPDYVHCTRLEFRALMSELVNVIAAPEGEAAGADAGARDSRRPARQIRTHFVERLNAALGWSLMPGTHHEELALRVFLEDLMWIDKRGEDLAGTLEPWGAWSAKGVGGVLARMFGGSPGDHAEAVASVYADVAHMWGYLQQQRTLTDEEYAHLRSVARDWTAAADRSTSDVIDAFGKPSLWRMSRDFRRTVSLAYSAAIREDPLVVFDFWQEAGQDGQSPLSPQPVLRDVRWRVDGLPFPSWFTYSPSGRALLKDGS